MILICAVLMACAVPAPEPTSHYNVCTTVQCFKDAQRKQYTRECVKKHMPQYVNLMSIGLQPETPWRWCSEQAKRVVP